MSIAENLPHPAPVNPSDWVAPDCQGLNFFDIDKSLKSLLKLYLPADLLRHMTPHYASLGEIAGGRLDGLALHELHVIQS